MIVKSLPSLFTIGNLFLGIVSLVLAFNQEFEYAAIMVIIGMFLDGVDGRVARMLNAQSEFGKELDSLSDVISFGVAPAFIMYMVILNQLGVSGVLLTALFPICGALRLARFNTKPAPPNYFVGLPITAAGGILATFALYENVFAPWMLMVGMILLSYLMVSSVKYPNFKKVGIPRHTFWVIPLLLAVIILVAIRYPEEFPKVIFLPLGLYAGYALYGMYRSFIKIIRRRTRRDSDYREEHE